MKKLLCALMAAAVLSAGGMAEASPSCVLMKFTDDTRFDTIDSAGTLSDLLMEKLLNSGKFNFKETKVIPENMEKRLYDEKSNFYQSVKWAAASGSFNSLFESAAFSENMAESIASARLGQIVDPEIVRSIGSQHGAEYLIQGTILNLGSGDWLDTNFETKAQLASTAVSTLGGSGAAQLLGPLGSIASGIKVSKASMGVEADVKIIRASTGEVVWKRSFIASNTTKLVKFSILKFGSDKLNDEMYYKAIDGVAQNIADALVADIDAGKLFL